MTQRNESLVKKWAPLLEHESFDPIADRHKKNVTAAILENTEKATAEEGYTPMSSLVETTNVVGNDGYTHAATATGPVAGYDPVLIKLVRRTVPSLMAYDICGVQPMSGPVGLIFARRAMYANTPANNATWTEAQFNEADTSFSGTGTHADNTGNDASVQNGTGQDTADAELAGTDGGAAWGEMALSLERVTVTAKERLLKANYTHEMAQDLRAQHGLDAEAELSDMLATEIVAEINREVVRTIYNNAVTGAQADVATAGTFDLDVDSNGRWSAEKFKGLMFQIDREANAILNKTRRGRGNIIIASPDVVSALQHAGVLDYTPAINNSLNVDYSGSTYAGVLNGRYKVYIDPYAGNEYMVVGYKGSNAFDAGVFYCPYVPLQMYKAIGENSFQPRIGFKTRYGLVANPFAQGATQGAGALTANTNEYYRRVLVRNLM